MLPSSRTSLLITIAKHEYGISYSELLRTCWMHYDNIPELKEIIYEWERLKLIIIMNHNNESFLVPSQALLNWLHLPESPEPPLRETKVCP